MSLAWIGRRASRYLIVIGLVAACVYALGKPQLPRIGFTTAVAGVPVNRTAPPLTGDQRLGGVLTCGRGTWDDPEGTSVRRRIPVGPRQPGSHRRDRRDAHGRARRRRSWRSLRRPRDQRATARPRPTARPSTRLPRTRSRRRGSAATCGSAARSPAPAASGTTTASPPTRPRRPWLRNGAVDRRPDGLHVHGHDRRRRPPDAVPRQRRSRSPARPPPASTPPRRSMKRRSPQITRRPATRRDAQLRPRHVGRRGPDARTPRPSSGCAATPRSSARPATTTRSGSPTSAPTSSCRVRAADLTDSTSSSRLPDQPRRSARSPASRATRGSAAASPASAARGTTPAAPASTRSTTSGIANNVFISDGRDATRSPTSTSTSRCAAQVTVEGLTQSNTPDDLRHAAATT